jgi:hypothetical protein
MDTTSRRICVIDRQPAGRIACLDKAIAWAAGRMKKDCLENAR